MHHSISPQKLRDWVADAQPNARLLYAEGTTLSECCASDLRVLVMDLAERGWLTPHNPRRCFGDHVKHFIVQRTNRPFLKGSKL
jgi:hypothetical protein